ncbi:hypothetical protein KY289_011501 [Solanum tuberosum]|nr:hypothetical protein KY289_011501 [Solanum tuberosum]
MKLLEAQQFLWNQLTIPILSPVARTPSNLRNSSSDGGHYVMMENHRILNVDRPLPASRSIAGRMSCPMESPMQQLPLSHSSTNQGIWYTYGDSAVADIFLTSKQLWLGSLGPDSSEVLVRHKFEMEIMLGNSLWGAGLRVKFMDKGLGTKGAINSAGVGSSFYIYVASVQSCWMKDDVVHELRKALQKGCYIVKFQNQNDRDEVLFTGPELLGCGNS